MTTLNRGVNPKMQVGKWKYTYGKKPHPAPLMDGSSGRSLATGNTRVCSHPGGDPNRVTTAMLESFMNHDDTLKIPMMYALPTSIHGMKPGDMIRSPMTKEERVNYVESPRLTLVYDHLYPDSHQPFKRTGKGDWSLNEDWTTIGGENKNRNSLNPGHYGIQMNIQRVPRGCPESFVNYLMYDDVYLAPYVPSRRRGRMMIMKMDNLPTTDVKRMESMKSTLKGSKDLKEILARIEKKHFDERFYHLRSLGWRTRYFGFKQRVQVSRRLYSFYEANWDSVNSLENIEGVYSESLKGKVPSVSGMYFGVGLFKPMASGMSPSNRGGNGGNFGGGNDVDAEARHPVERRQLMELSRKLGLGRWPVLWSWYRPHSVVLKSLRGNANVDAEGLSNGPCRSIYAGEDIRGRRQMLELSSGTYAGVMEPFSRAPLTDDTYLHGWVPRWKSKSSSRL